MLNVDDTVLVVVDIQGKLAQLMHDKQRLFDNVARLIQGAGVLTIPVVCTEQNPDGLGPTIEQLAGLIRTDPISKFSFSCCDEPRFIRELETLGRKGILLTGIETHICVYQTAVGLLGRGYDVHIVADAVSSRTADNRQIGLDAMAAAGAKATSAEMALFELLGVAKGAKFKQILKLVK